MRLPNDCVRGRIRRFIETHAPLLGDDVLRQWVGDEMAGIYDRVFNRGKIAETEGKA